MRGIVARMLFVRALDQATATFSHCTSGGDVSWRVRCATKRVRTSIGPSHAAIAHRSTFGMREEALSLVTEMQNQSADTYVPPQSFVFICAA